jgi:hypothetical protein
MNKKAAATLLRKTGRKLKEATKRKIGQSLKNKGRKAGSAIQQKALSPGSKKQSANSNLSSGLTGYKTAGKVSGASKTRKGNAGERAAKDGFTGYTPKSKSDQNKYTQNLRNVLKS